MVADGIIAVTVSPLHAAAPSVAAVQAAGASLTDEALQAAGREAIARWAASGVPADQLAKLHHTVLVAADLPPGLLGLASSQVIWIDRDAAGSGWYVDPVPSDDVEFPHATAAGEWVAGPSSPAAGRFDLLTAVVHELGHILGLDDHDGRDAMGAMLPLGTRRLPNLEASIALRTSLSPQPLHSAPSLLPAWLDLAGDSLPKLAGPTTAELSGPPAQEPAQPTRVRLSELDWRTR
jgi:hypothetical protein